MGLALIVLMLLVIVALCLDAENTWDASGALEPEEIPVSGRRPARTHD